MPWSTSGSILGPTGPAGSPGAAGPTGPSGPSGATGPAGLGINFKGSVATFAALPGTPADGDGYLVADEADKLYVWDQDTTTWVDGGSIQGPPGTTGPTGPRGTSWFTGTGSPPSEISGSLPGDLYLDLATGDVYVPGSGIPVGDLPAIGSAYGGGFQGGLINRSGDGIATHALIIAPAATGQALLAAKTTNTATAGNEGQILTVAAGAQVMPLTFTQLGSAGLLLLASCDAPAWLSLYVSAEAMAADGARLQSQDPAPDAGVVLDLVFPEGTTVLRLPPGISWANQDDPVVATLHGRLRTDLPAPADVAVALSGLLLIP